MSAQVNGEDAANPGARLEDAAEARVWLRYEHAVQPYLVSLVENHVLATETLTLSRQQHGYAIETSH